MTCHGHAHMATKSKMATRTDARTDTNVRRVDNNHVTCFNAMQIATIAREACYHMTHWIT